MNSSLPGPTNRKRFLDFADVVLSGGLAVPEEDTGDPAMGPDREVAKRTGFQGEKSTPCCAESWVIELGELNITLSRLADMLEASPLGRTVDAHETAGSRSLQIVDGLNRIATALERATSNLPQLKSLPQRSPTDAMTVQEAASGLNVCEETIRRAIASGHLGAERIGRCLRVSATGLQRWRAAGGLTNSRTRRTSR
jgi:excisionase family DNA binding protein